jgi:hypothetical protein
MGTWKPAPGEGYGTATFSLTSVVAPDYCLFANDARQYVLIQLISGGPVAIGPGFMPIDATHGIVLASGTNDAYEMSAAAGNLFVGDIYAAGTGTIGILEGV